MRNTNRRIKLFLLDKMRYTPFDRTFSDDYKCLEKRGVFITDSIEKADLFVCSTIKKKLLPVILKNYKTPILLWTNEPRSSNFTKDLYFPVKIKFLNVYSGKVAISEGPCH